MTNIPIHPTELVLTPGALRAVAKAIAASVTYIQAIQSEENRARLTPTILTLQNKGPAAEKLGAIVDAQDRFRELLTDLHSGAHSLASSKACPLCDPNNERAEVWADVTSQLEAFLKAVA